MGDGSDRSAHAGRCPSGTKAAGPRGASFGGEWALATESLPTAKSLPIAAAAVRPGRKAGERLSSGGTAQEGRRGTRPAGGISGTPVRRSWLLSRICTAVGVPAARYRLAGRWTERVHGRDVLRPPPVDEVVADLNTCRTRLPSRRATPSPSLPFKRLFFVADGNRLGHAWTRSALSCLSGCPGACRFTCRCERENYTRIHIK